MSNYRATPLTAETQERVEVTQEKQPEVIIVSWDIHEDELPPKEKTGEKQPHCLETTISGQ